MSTLIKLNKTNVQQTARITLNNAIPVVVPDVMYMLKVMGESLGLTDVDVKLWSKNYSVGFFP